MKRYTQAEFDAFERCIAGVYDKFYRYNRTDDGQAYDKAWRAQNQITQNEKVTFLYTE